MKVCILLEQHFCQINQFSLYIVPNSVGIIHATQTLYLLYRFCLLSGDIFYCTDTDIISACFLSSLFTYMTYIESHHSLKTSPDQWFILKIIYFRISLGRDKWGKWSLLLISRGAPHTLRYQSLKFDCKCYITPFFYCLITIWRCCVLFSPFIFVPCNRNDKVFMLRRTNKCTCVYGNKMHPLMQF